MSSRPLLGIGPATHASDAGRRAGPDDVPLVVDVRFVDATALATLQVPLVEGRGFDQHVDSGGPPRVIVSRELAERIWPGRSAIGQRLRLDLFDSITPEVIGVSSDVHLRHPRTPPRSIAWLSALRFPDGERDVVVRTSGTPESIVAALRAAVESESAGLPVYRVATESALVREALAADRFATLLLSGLATVAVVLGLIGIFGVFSADVMQRRREIGVRLALGGSAAAIVLLVLRRAGLRAGLGIVVGLGLAAWFGTQMRALLFEVEPTDASTLVLVASLMAALAAVATILPTIQALRARPLRVLREG